MITILLQKILDLLEAHFPGVITLLSKLNLIEEDTEEMRANVDSMKTTLEDVDAQATAAAGSLNQINTTATTINGNVAAIKNNSEAIKNNVMSMSTNVGNISAYSEATANNTLDIDEKITSIASDTTDIRTSNNDIALENSKIYDAVKWLLSDKDITEDASGLGSVSFDTDYADLLEALKVGISATQSGSGNPSPDNVRPISGYSDINITVNGNNITIALGQTVYGGILDVISGFLKITHGFYTITNSTSFTNFIPSAQYGPYVRIASIGIQKIDSNKVLSICDMANGVSFNDRTINPESDRIFSDTQGYINLRPSVNATISNATDIKNRFMGAVIVYELASPIEVQLTPEQITTIKGLNTISTDTNGEINVTYKESIKNYLDKRD